MDNAVYKRNVFKTLSVKPAKVGLKYVSRNTNRTNVMHSAIGIFTEAGELVEGLTQYILGSSKLTEKMKINAFEEMGDIGYYMMVLSKSLKVKLPASSKKVRLKGRTRSAGILELMAYTAEIANLSKKVFYGPVTKSTTREKTVSQMNPDGTVAGMTKVQETVEVLDAEQTATLYAQRDAQVKAILEEKLVPLYWALCFDMFEVPPSYVFVGNIAKLSKRYGEGFFQLSEAEARDIEEEMDSMTPAMS